MAAQSRKQTLIAELAATRAHLTGDVIVVCQDMDFGARVKSHYARHPYGWFGAAAVLGVVLSRLLPARGKGAAVRYYQVEKPGKAAFVFTALKFAVSLAKPVIMSFLAKKTQSNVETP